MTDLIIFVYWWIFK